MMCCMLLYFFNLTIFFKLIISARDPDSGPTLGPVSSFSACPQHSPLISCLRPIDAALWVGAEEPHAAEKTKKHGGKRFFLEKIVFYMEISAKTKLYIL